MNEEILEEIEEPTETEPQTEEPLETEAQSEDPTTTTQTETEPVTSSDYAEGFPDNSENVIHELFATLGVNVDYVPSNKAQAFTMTLQLACAMWFITWFVKLMYTLLRGFLTGGSR